MRALVTRELIVAARRPAVVLAACGIAAGLTGFVLAWAPGVPLGASMNLYDQTRVLHWLLLVVALPWTAVRSASAERGDDLVVMATFMGVPPGRVVLGKILSTFIVLVLVSVSGLPALVIAQQAAAVPLWAVVVDVLPLPGIALLAAVSAMASILVASDTVGAWLAGAGAVLAVLLAAAIWTSSMAAVGFVAAVAGLAVAGFAVAGSTRRLCYLGDTHVE